MCLPGKIPSAPSDTGVDARDEDVAGEDKIEKWNEAT